MRRYHSLDVLRGVAVLAVMCRHYVIWLPMAAGWAGVDLFFVLSGFLISGLLFTDYKQNGRISVGRFLVRRGLKIYPPYYAFLFLTAWLLSRPILPYELFFLQNYFAS